MAFYSIVDLVGANNQSNFSFSFPYLSAEHIHVYINEVETTSFTLSSTYIVTLSPPLSTSSFVRIRRITPIDEPLVDYQNGSNLGESDLDIEALQGLYAIQELADTVLDESTGYLPLGGDGNWDATDLRIANVADPVGLSDAVNKGYFDDHIEVAVLAEAAAAASASQAAGSATAANTSAGIANASIATTQAASDNANTAANNARAAANSANTANTNAWIANTTATNAATNAQTANTNAQTANTNAQVANTNAQAANTSAWNAVVTGQAAFNKANSANNLAQAAYDQANLANTIATSGAFQANTAQALATLGYVISQAAFEHANGAFDKANTANVTGQAAFDKANSGFTLATTANTVAASAYNQANIATTNADAAFAHANGGFSKANSSNNLAQAAFDKANSAIYTAAQIRANISNTTPILYDPTTGMLSHVNSGVSATGYGDSTHIPVFVVDNTGHITSVSNVAIEAGATDVYAREHANGAFDKANTANVTGQAAFDKANSGFTLATTANTVAASAYNQANIATTNADAAFARANAAYANANSAIYTAAQIRANISNTTPILYDPTTGVVSLTTVPVTLGGTGQTSYSNGDLLIGNTMSGGLDRANLTQGYGISITNSNGRITIDAAIGKTYYLVLSQASDVATYNVASILPSAHAEVNTSVIYTGTSYSLAASFLTAPGEPGTALLPAGTYGRHFHATTDGLNNEGQLRVDLYKYAANTLETLLRSNESPIFNSDDAAALLLNWNITDPASYALEETDRLLFKVYVRRVSGGSGSVRVTVFYEGTSRASYIPTTILTAGADAFARLQANAAYNHANGAFGHANGAYNKANVATTNADAAFAQANAAYANANTAIYTAAQIRANISASLPISYSSATGVISLPATANGQTLIGNTVSGTFDVATIAQTAPVIVTNGKGTVTLSHASSGVTAAVYGNGSIIPSITIDAFGHITGAVNTAVAIDGSQVTTGNIAVARGGTGQVSYTNGQILIGNTGSTGLDKATIAQSAPVIVTVAQGLITLSHARSGVTAVDSYGSAAIVPVFAVDANGHLTAVVNTSIAISAAAVTSGILSVARGGTGKDATGLTNGQILIANTVNTGFDLAAVTQTAPVIVSTDKGSIRLSHARSGVTAATYGSASLIPVITVDDNGHVTTITTSAASGLPAATANGQLLVGNTVSSSFDVYTPAQSAPVIVTVGKGTITYSHARSGVVASTYGSASLIPVITIDDNGHITTATTATAASGGGGVTLGLSVAVALGYAMR